MPDKNEKNRYIYLVRHAKPELPHGGRIYYGRTDYPLSDEGIKKAKTLVPYLRGINFNFVYSSNLIRARHTAELILPERKGDIREAAGLNEIDLGEWEGRTFDEVRSSWEELYEKRGSCFDSVPPPQGESFKDLQARVVPAFEEILHRHVNGNILIVAHGGVIWTLMCRILGFRLNDMFYYPMDYCGIHLLRQSGEHIRMIKYNWSPVLS